MYDILGIDFCLDVGADDIPFELLRLRYAIIIEFEKALAELMKYID